MSKKRNQPAQPLPKHKQRDVKKTSLASYTRLWEILGILLLVFITYGNSIKNDYNFDDSYVVSLDNTNLLTQKGISGIPEILTSNYNQGLGVTYGYRPLGKITMAIEYSLWQNNPHYSHFVNILLFALNVYLLLLFFKKIAGMMGYRDVKMLYIGIVLFIVHPIHTEVVCSIKNREEILCFTLMLGALLYFIKFFEDKKWKYIVPFVLLISLAFLAKESAVNIAGILIMILFIRLYVLNDDRKAIWRKMAGLQYVRKLNAKWLIGLGLLLFFFILLKDIRGLFEIFFLTGIVIGLIRRNSRNVMMPYLEKILHSKPVIGITGLGIILLFALIVKHLHDTVFAGDIVTHFEQNPYHFFSFGHDFIVGVQTLFFYFKKLFFPYPLLFYYGYNMLPLQGWDTILPYAGILFLLAVTGLSIYSFYKRKILFAVFSLLFLMVTIFPFSNFIPEFYVTGIVAERLAYQASAGFCMLMAWVLYVISLQIKTRTDTTIKEKFRTPYIITGLLSIPFFVMTVNRNGDWEDKSTLFRHDIKFLGNSARANYLMASRFMNEIGNGSGTSMEEVSGKVQLASSYLHNAIKVYPEYNDAWLNLGIIQYQFFSRKDSALICFSQVDTTDRFIYARAREYLGDIAYNDLKNKEQAKAYYLQGFRYMPERNILYQKITKLLFETMRYDSIIVFSDRGIKNNFPEAYLDKANAFVFLKDTISAIPYYNKALENGYSGPLLINLKEYYQNHKNDK